VDRLHGLDELPASLDLRLSRWLARPPESNDGRELRRLDLSLPRASSDWFRIGQWNIDAGSALLTSVSGLTVDTKVHNIR